MNLSSKRYQDYWMKWLEIYHYLDRMMENIIREAIEEIEKTYQQK